MLLFPVKTPLLSTLTVEASTFVLSASAVVTFVLLLLAVLLLIRAGGKDGSCVDEGARASVVGRGDTPFLEDGASGPSRGRSDCNSG